jgi:hypothetical protein
MPLVHLCAEPGCGTLTMGKRCLEHEQLARKRLANRTATLVKRFRSPAIAVGIATAAALAGRVSRHMP